MHTQTHAPNDTEIVLSWANWCQRLTVPGHAGIVAQAKLGSDLFGPIIVVMFNNELWGRLSRKQHEEFHELLQREIGQTYEITVKFEPSASPLSPNRSF